MSFRHFVNILPICLFCNLLAKITIRAKKLDLHSDLRKEKSFVYLQAKKALLLSSTRKSDAAEALAVAD